MNEKVKKIGAYGTLGTMAIGLLMNAYAQVRTNQLDIARIQEREKSTKEIILRVERKEEYRLFSQLLK